MTIADIVPAQVSLDHEKRGKKRFAIDHEVRYRTLVGQRVVETGMGRTINISSSGVCFTSEKRLPIGTSVELSINWPVLLEDACPMKLMLQGCVIRSSNDVAILAITQYEFRTQGSHSLQSSLRDAEPWQALESQSHRSVCGGRERRVPRGTARGERSLQ